MKKNFTLGLLLLSSHLFAQISFQQFPSPLQLYPRDLVTNTANLQIAGTATQSSDSLVFTLTKSDGSEIRKTLALNNLSNQSFEENFELQAGLWSYDLKVQLKTPNTLVLLREANNLVAGDVFVVEGQSNAQAVAYNGDANIWQHNFIRSFGTPNPDVFNDKNWRLAEGNGYFTPGAVGQWALRMGYLLQQNLNVPIAIINGADPGKPIEFFQRNDAQPLDSTTNYGRLLQRLINADVSEHVRGLIYYQGESDGDRALIHKTLFEALHAAWEQDLPNIEGYYIVQVREGCGGPTLQLREYQRAFEDYLHHAKAVTANGINGHDGCHYDVNGYNTLGEKLYKQISADLFQTPTGAQTNIRVLSASFSNELNTQITLVTDATGGLIAEAGCAADFRISGSGASVIGAQADGNKLILELDQSVSDPNSGISYGGHAGSNAWVLNSDGYGMFTFYNRKVDNYHEVPNYGIPGIMSGSGNCISLDGADDYLYVGPVIQNSYTKEAWINWPGGSQLNNLISGGGGAAFWAPNGQLSAGHNGEWFQVTDNVALPTNQWVHVAVTYDGASGALSLYKNGKLVSQAQNIPTHNDPEIYIGAFVGCCTFRGSMDEVRIWDTVRTIEEIRANMCQKLPDSIPHLRGYFRFDETNGNLAPNTTSGPDAQLLNFQGLGLNEAWKRSGAPIGTKSVQTYQNTPQLSLSIPSGDSLVLTTESVPDFVHLYFVEEVPNVLQPADGYAVVDNSRYFGLFYANQSISHYDVKYHYSGNPFAMVQEDNLGLLRRRNNAQFFWETTNQTSLDPAQNSIQAGSSSYQEYILAIRDSIQYPPLSASVSIVQPILCNGFNDGVIAVIPQGGQAPYSFSLNGGIPQASGVFSGLGSGDYTVWIMDQAGDTLVSNTLSLQSPDPLIAAIQVSGNNANSSIEGGTAPYTTSSNAPNPDLQNLPNGSYFWMVTDANGCTISIQFFIDFQPFTISTTLVDTDICDGLADLVVVAQGGEAPYQYSLNNGPYQPGNTFTGLIPGAYSVVASDFNGQSIALDPVDILIPYPLVADAIAGAGSIVVSPHAGTYPYTYALNGGPAQADSIFSGLTPGAYNVVVMDANGCSITLDGLLITSSATDLSKDQAIQISPNPSTGIFSIHGIPSETGLSASVWDVTGRLVQSFDLSTAAGSSPVELDLSNQANGVYWLQLSSPYPTRHFRLVKID